MTSHYSLNNVCRIYMKNFLTYDEIEVRPKPHLNVIIGPNGTGKSSIICALCIGLGGKPYLTGRGKSIGDYIKHGKESALTEIEFHRNEEPNVVVNCSFTRTSTEWRLNGIGVSRKQVEKKMKELNIQVDNLCMFLPQDRVADFAKMNRIQLLENTEKSVVPKDEGPTLLEQHELLKESGKVLSDLESKIEKLSEELESEKKRNANIEDQVKNNDLKKKIEKEIEDLKTRYTWYLYCEKRQEKMDSKERKAVMEEQWSVLTKKLKPAENRMEKYRGESNSCREKAKKHENEIKELEPLLDRICQNVEDQEDAIKAAEVELAHHRQQEDQRKREIKDMERHLSVIERELAELEPFDEDALKEKIADLTMQIQNFSQAFTKMRQAMDDDRYQKEALNRKTSGHKKELEELEDVKRRRLEALRQQNQQVFSAVMWLHNNRDKFKGKVYDPMCTVINVLDSGYCKYVEDRISRQDMVAFVCEDKEDMNKFKKFMDQEKLRVNIVHAPHGDPKAFQAKTPIEELQQYGFEKYMSCVMTAPDAVMSYLCKNYNIHRIPVAKSGDFENVPPSVNYFYIDDSRYSKSQSRYDRQWSTSIITVRQPRLLTFSENTERKNDIIRTLEKLRIEMKQIDDKIEKAHAQQKEITQNIEKARDEKKRLVQDREHRDQLKKRVLMKRKQIENRKSKAINMEEKEAEYRKKCEKYTGNAVMKVKEVHKILTKATKGSECSMQCAIKQRLFKERILSLEKDVQGVKQEKEKLEELIQKEHLKGKEILMEAQKLLKELCRAFNVNSVENIPEEAKTRILEGKLKTSEKIKEQISKEEAKRDCLITADDSIVNEYNQREQAIEKLTEELERVKTNLTKQSSNIEKSRKEWLPRVQELTTKINEKFSGLFARLGCAGEVSLDKGENGNDFSKYGLLIQVKFRDTESLRELSRHHQSGGERAMSTALYLLALQALTVVPFRCVDEINQGMDQTNERRMFSMLLETASARQASQYFLVTPKLLPDLEYNERVSYMFVFSPNPLPERRFNIAKILVRQKNNEVQKKRRRI